MTEHPGCGASWTALGAAHCSACCATFAGLSLFDAHRSAHGEHGSCTDPARLANRAGERIAFHRDGMWRGPEMDEATKLACFGARDRRARPARERRDRTPADACPS